MNLKTKTSKQNHEQRSVKAITHSLSYPLAVKGLGSCKSLLFSKAVEKVQMTNV